MKIRTIIYAIIAISLAGGLLWFFFLRTPVQPSVDNTTPLGVVDVGTTVENENIPSLQGEATEATLPGQQVKEKVFKIADGPVTGATFVEIRNPTSTLARYTTADNGHTFDLAIDVPGAVAKNTSNTTIPGILHTVWGEQGKVSILQYITGTNLKTVSLTFPQAATSTTSGVKLQFFPDGIAGITLSPDGTQAAYVLRNGEGVDGYISKSDGSGSKKVFSIPLTQVILSWPESETLLAQSKSAYNAPGILFSVNAKSGNVVPLLYATGLVAIADSNFSHVVYQSTAADTNTITSYSHNVETGADQILLFNPFPEKCTWGPAPSVLLYCARPFGQVAPSYMDNWRAGATSASDTIFVYNLLTNRSSTVVTPGGNQGGENSDIVSMSVSPNGKYLLFIKKGDRSLWGVRLSQ